MFQGKSSAHKRILWFMYNKSCVERLNTWLQHTQSVDLNVHSHSWLSEVPCHSDRNLGCLHSCFGSKRDVLTLALFQPLLLGQKCQLVHKKQTVGASDAFSSVLTSSFSSLILVMSNSWLCSPPQILALRQSALNLKGLKKKEKKKVILKSLWFTIDNQIPQHCSAIQR